MVEGTLVGSRITRTLSWWRQAAPSLIALAALLCVACQPDCPEGLHPYKGKCLTRTSIEYLGCTEGRGISCLVDGRAQTDGAGEHPGGPADRRGLF
jgi:hypothetical protein